MARHWSINGRFLGQPVTGVQRYAREITLALDQLVADGHALVRDLELELLCPTDVNPAELPLRHIKLRMAGRARGHAWEQIELPRLARGGILSLANLGPLASRRQVVCIHDLNTRIAPQSYTWQFRALYGALLPALGARVARIATVSQFSADQIARFGVAPSSRISVIPNGHEHVLQWQAEADAALPSASGASTIAVIGSRAPHKNVGMLLALAPELERMGLRLAVVGAANSKVFAGHGSGIEAANVDWLGRLSDAQIAALLKRCLCLAFPSLTEGFGLPPLEAFALGCPVVTTDRASLPEICGDAALYAAPDDPQRWLAQFRRLQAEPVLGDALRARGREAAKRFSWRRSAEQYLELLAGIDGIETTSSNRTSIYSKPTLVT